MPVWPALLVIVLEVPALRFGSGVGFGVGFGGGGLGVAGVAVVVVVDGSGGGGEEVVSPRAVVTPPS